MRWYQPTMESLQNVITYAGRRSYGLCVVAPGWIVHTHRGMHERIDLMAGSFLPRRGPHDRHNAKIRMEYASQNQGGLRERSRSEAHGYRRSRRDLCRGQRAEQASPARNTGP